MNQLEAVELSNLYLEEENMHIQLKVQLNSEYTLTFDKYQLLVIERHSKTEQTFPLRLLDSVDEIEAFIPILKINGISERGNIWDLYVTASTEPENRTRVRSRNPVLEKNYFMNGEVLIIPYTTGKGNLSIKTDDQELIAKFTGLEWLDKDALQIQGFFAVPGFPSSNTVEHVLLIIENVASMDVLYSKLLKFNEEEGSYSFKETINISSFIPDIEVGKYHFILEVQYKKDGKFLKDASKPLTLTGVPISQFPYIKKLTGTDGKKKVRFYLSKKAKYFMISADRESFMLTLKRTWTKFKRLPITKKLYKTAFQIIGVLPANRKLIMFESFLGKQYSCNPRAIYEYLKLQYPELKLYWSVDKRYIHNFQDKDVKIVLRFSVKWLFLMASAKYWVTNSRLPLWIPKPRHTVYLQTWHGTPLKRLAADMEEVHMPGTNTEKYKENFLKEAERWDYLISPNQYSSEIFRRAFQFNKEMIESGYPRNDFLFSVNNEEDILKLKEHFQIPADKKVILYAPTWRDDQFYEKGKYKFDLKLDLQMMAEQLGEEYVVILRLHYLVAENIDVEPFGDFVLDFSNHEDIRELYVISDVLITDYSSVFFDFANLKRPMLFFVYDIDDYRDRLRGFYFDFEKKAPGPLVKTTEEIIDEIRKFEENGFSLPPHFEDFYQTFCAWEDGRAATRVAERVFEKSPRKLPFGTDHANEQSFSG